MKGRGRKAPGAARAVGTVDIRMAQLVAAVATGAGARHEALAAILARPSTERIQVTEHFAIWEVAMRATRLSALPMHVARKTTVEALGVLGYAIYVARTARDAIVRVARFNDVFTDSGRFSLAMSRDRATVAWDRPGPRTLGMRAANEHALAAAAHLLETHTGVLPVIEVRFRHPRPADVSEHERLFRAPLHFDAPGDEVVFPSSYMDQPLRGGDATLEAYLVDQLAQTAARVAGGQDFLGATSREILHRLPSGLPSAREVAEALGTSERTLFRRLADDGATFASLVTALQRDRAEAMLAQNVPIAEIALSIGFSDATAFTRAFRRWTGVPPSRFSRKPSGA